MKKVPEFKTDAEAEAFLDQDLSDLDFSQFKPTRFEFERKAGRLNMRLPEALLDAVKTRARQRGIPFTRYIRELIERDLAPTRNREDRAKAAPPNKALCRAREQAISRRALRAVPERAAAGMRHTQPCGPVSAHPLLRRDPDRARPCSLLTGGTGRSDAP